MKKHGDVIGRKKEIHQGAIPKKILVIGGKGQLGQSLNLLLSELYSAAISGMEFKFLDLPEFDLLDQYQVKNQLTTFRPQVVINAAAYTQVDHAEAEKEMAYAVNAQAVKILAETVQAVNARLIHISTDYVFSGKNNHHQEVEEIPEPINIYGQSKLAGELALKEVPGLNWICVRTAWLYSNVGHNFLNTMLRCMQEKRPLRVVSDQIGTPTTALSLARTLLNFLQQPDLAGLYHWTDAGTASWYDFAVAIQEEALRLGLLSQRTSIVPIETSDYPTPAPRPQISLLSKNRVIKDLKIQPKHWSHSLRETLEQRLALEKNQLDQNSKACL